MLQNQKLGTKLAIGFGLVTAIAMAIGVVALLNARTLAGNITEIGANRLPSVQSLLVIQQAQTAIDSAENALLYPKNDAEALKSAFDRIDHAWKRVDLAWKRYDGLPQATEEAELWKKFVPAWNAWKVDHQHYVEMAKAYWGAAERRPGDYERMANQGLVINYKTFDPASDQLGDLVALNQRLGDEAMEHAHRDMVVAQWMIWSAIALGVVLAAILALLITRGITRPVISMCTALEGVAEGDLTVSTGIDQKDEIGQMAAALDRTVANLAEVMSEIREAADQTAASGEELSASAQNISSGAQTQASTVEEINAAIQELGKSIEQVAGNAGEANQVAQGTASTAGDGRQIVERSIEGMKAISDSSNQIAKIIGVINQIANQTNLLALNAAIEAASAGEHGLGFAVVADEVRKLAERSSTAAQEIAQLIDESGKRVGEGTGLSQEVGRSLQAIIEGITRTTQGMAGISAGTEEQASSAREVGKSVESISAITEENSASAEEMAASAEELSAQAQRLQELVARFRLTEESALSERSQRKTSGAAARKSSNLTVRKTANQSVGAAKRRSAVLQQEEGEENESPGKALYHE